MGELLPDTYVYEKFIERLTWGAFRETIGASARESGELSLNSSDAGTETFDRDLALSMVANDQEALEEIEDAIDRIFDGSYGICQETNKPIKKIVCKQCLLPVFRSRDRCNMRKVPGVSEILVRVLLLRFLTPLWGRTINP